MDKRPIRRKYKDNTYRLMSEESKGLYLIKFKDSNNKIQEVEVSKEIFDLFDSDEKYENARFFEHATRFTKSKIEVDNMADEESVEDKIIKNSINKELKDSINKLPKIQKDRIIKYFFKDKTYEEIAKEENCSKVAIKYSIDNALKNISKKIKK